MKMKTILGAIICFILAICTMHAIADPPDSPPHAEAAKENIKSEMPANLIYAMAPAFIREREGAQGGEYASANKNTCREYRTTNTARAAIEHYDIGDH